MTEVINDLYHELDRATQQNFSPQYQDPQAILLPLSKVALDTEKGTFGYSISTFNFILHYFPKMSAKQQPGTIPQTHFFR